MKRRSFLYGLGVLGLAACSPAPASASTSTRDPSNPNAPEGANPAPPASTKAPAAATVYVCPMHPEVTSGEPGICPKCNMKLVPKT
jgi:hypothetical protein